ncbi:c-type cytochrome [Roseicella aquatilis]|uniref:C-type cytochrome n=1 Tax=Roseicella aquatilis TaxID=2527868 RepID=A0A4R4D461_9PROT|nr:c-type cytochrome [Roseicella aquatilis]TCZ52774.1 c-type cytochrome [Roseicella aquatilis]
MRTLSLNTVIALTFAVGVPALFLAGPDRGADRHVAPVAATPPAARQAAAPPAVAPPAGGRPASSSPASAPVAQQPATPAAWEVPDPDSLPEDAFGRTVRRGRDLIAKTSSLIGPDAADPAMRFAGNGLECQSCHLRAGTQQFGLPLAGVWGVFPTYIGREDEVRTLEERVNGCMERSMNGRALPVDGPEMKAILTYIRFISGPERVGQSLRGRGSPPLPLPERAADPEHGRQVFATTCAACHGADGQGQRNDRAHAAETGRRYQFPPLWGPDSYNDGAGMARTITAARFVHANMPLGTTFEAPVLSAEDAFDVMAFVNSRPRPHKEGLERDYPDRSKKPVDAAYPPFVGPFPPEQHRYGPWQPIQDWLRAHPEAARATR